MALAPSFLFTKPAVAAFFYCCSPFRSRTLCRTLLNFPCIAPEGRAGKGTGIYCSSMKHNEHVPYYNTSSVDHHCHDSSRHPLMLAKVKSGEAEGGPSAEEMAFDEPSLQRELEKAVEEEDYVRAAKLRDGLRAVHEGSRAAVLSANAGFYRAFRNGDLAALRSIWARGEEVYVVHPGAGRISGYELVMDSWEVVCGAEHEFPIGIDLKDVEVHVRGDVGYVTCVEVVKTRGSNWGKQMATNVFERIGGEWFICIHHASYVAE